jgi:predicted Ser/Thr protein kinase
VDCIGPDTILELLQGELRGAARADVDVHLDRCSACRALVAEMARGSADGNDRGRRVERVLPAEIGRFRIDGELGRGAMGIVYAGHDRELRRDVAIKVVRSAFATTDDAMQSGAQERLLREAEAMAKVSHENVIRVFDVGTFEGGVFIAMERIDGQTLRAWLAERPRREAEIVDAFVQAGRGLKAAHEAGLVHRDFKPDNVLRDHGGRIVVTDFGLARVERDVSATLGAGRASSRTVTGLLVGTPAYMAPEQLEGKRGDARVDQFSFCVALHEALGGVRPFTGDTTAELRAAIVRGAMRHGPRPIRAKIRSVILRGLAVDPRDRFGDMAALVGALERCTARSYLGVAALGATLGVGLLAFAMARDGGCRAPDLPWPSEHRDAIERALPTAGTDGGETAARVTRSLEGFAASFGDVRGALCEAPADDADPRWLCLERRRARFVALVQALTQSRGDASSDVITAVLRLPDPGDCLENGTEPPSKVDAEVANRLAEAHALADLARWTDAITAARASVEAARTSGDTASEAEAAVLLGHCIRSAGDPVAAEAELKAAYDLATEQGDDRNAADAAKELAFAVGVTQSRHDEGLRWARYAQAALDRFDADAVRLASLQHTLGHLRSEQGDEETAFAAYEKAVAIMQAAGKDDDVRFGGMQCSLAESLHTLGRFVEARPKFEAVLHRLEERLGESHDTLTACQLHFGNALLMQQDLDAAEDVLTRALDGARKGRGPDHPSLARYIEGIATLRMHQRRSGEAADLYREVVTIDERAKGSDHPMVATNLANLGAALDEVGRHDEARAAVQRALDITRATMGEEHPRVGRLLMLLGVFARRAGDFDRARDFLEQAVASLTASRGADHPAVAAAREELGTALLQTDPEAALPVLHRALADFTAANGPEDPNLAHTHARIAEALLALDRRAEAREHFSRASELLTPRLGPDHPHVIEMNTRRDALDE